MKLLVPFALLAVGFLSFALRDGQERYLLTGSSTVAPILEKAAEAIDREDPGLRLDVQTGGSTRGIVDIREGRCDAGMASRELLPEEALGLHVKPVAYDGIAVIVNVANPVTSLTSDQVRGLFRDEITDWSALGSEGEVFVVSKAEGRATLKVFLEHFGLENSQIAADAVIGDNAQGVRLVAGNQRAVGYVSIGEALTAVERGVPIRLVALDGVEPTLESVADGSYPVRRTLYVLFREPLRDVDRRLIRHLDGPIGRTAARELSFVPLSSGPGR